MKRQHLSNPEFIRVLILRTIGNFLVLASLFMIGKTLYQPAKEELRYVFNTTLGKTYIVADSSTQAKSLEKTNTNCPQGSSC